MKSISESKNKQILEFTARENTWSHQRRKRREDKQNDIPQPKKQKLEGEKPSEDFFLKGLLHLQLSDSVITLYIHWLDGGSGRESINQILLYLKNNLFNR